MKLSHSLKFRFISFFILFIIVLTTILVFTGVRQMSQTVIDTFSAQGIIVVERAASLIDGDSFEALSKSLDDNDPFYEETRLQLLGLKEITGCVYLYTMTYKKGDIWYFIIDGSAPIGDDDFSALGDEQDTSDYDPAFKRTVITQKTEISGLVDQGEWGRLISIYTPIKNSKEEMVGIIGCDFDGEELYKQIVSSEIQQIIIGLISIVIGICFLLIFMQMIFKPIKEINGILKEISHGDGDLTKQISNIKENEIGEMAHYFNKTFEKIRNLIILIKQSTKTLSDTGNDLTTNMSETAAAINQITVNIQNIKDRIINQSTSVSQTHSTMEQVVININKLNDHVDDQSSNISAASSSIEEMVANIRSVTDTLIRNTNNVKLLNKASELGRNSLQEVASDIKEIARESEGLLGINSVMENIASQTNLLSMNAAIEAAHAGEAGRGFAVVAGEIRKLAESAGQQSKTIGTVLKRIKGSIDKITHSTNNVLEKFEAIDSSVKTVADQEENIRNSMEEQQTGNKQILEGISNINHITRQVENGAQEMLEGSKEVIQESTSLESVTQEITLGMNEMAAGAHEINEAIEHVKKISRKNRDNIEILLEEISRFKV